jgi:hypothetical protein
LPEDWWLKLKLEVKLRHMAWGVGLAGALALAGLALVKLSSKPSKAEVASIGFESVACENFLGFGAEWDSRGYNGHGVTDEDFELIADRIRWMRLPLVRSMMQTKWCYLGEGKFEWETPDMQSLYRQLDLCQRENVTVLLTDWGCEPEWLKIPGIKDVADPLYAEAIATYMDHLVNQRGYGCIKYFILVNEPNYEVKSWDRWRKGLENVARAFAEKGLDKRVTLMGPDHSNADDWLQHAVDQLHDILGAYDIHRYEGDEVVRPGLLEEYFRRQWEYVRTRDPQSDGKPLVVGEAGLNDDADHPYGNRRIDSYEYGLFMADYAVQAARAGAAAVSAWMLDDNSHPGFYWGMWTNKEKGLKLRPWFCAWSLLSRYFPQGCTVHRMEQPSPDWRLLVANASSGSEGRAWSICLVNRGREPVDIRVKLPGGGEHVLKRFIYSRDSVGAAKGYPSPAWTGEADLSQALRVQCPPEAVVVESTLPY